MKKIRFLEYFHRFCYIKISNKSNFPGFLGKKGIGASKAEKSWKKEHKNRQILGKYLGQIKVFWRKKIWIWWFGVEFIPKKAFSRFFCLQPPLFGEKSKFWIWDESNLVYFGGFDGKSGKKKNQKNLNKIRI